MIQLNPASSLAEFLQLEVSKRNYSDGFEECIFEDEVTGNLNLETHVELDSPFDFFQSQTSISAARFYAKFSLGYKKKVKKTELPYIQKGIENAIESHNYGSCEHLTNSTLIYGLTNGNFKDKLESPQFIVNYRGRDHITLHLGCCGAVERRKYGIRAIVESIEEGLAIITTIENTFSDDKFTSRIATVTYEEIE